ncbi:hypothetical protein [Rhodopila globiformis]|uniref:hypothetical protein n=1 Tax=Rhodopila globiformis TaxID=1071 RepID=UPI0011B0D191|nr:hypothetical protein [Rhodopila globiformis]
MRNDPVHGRGVLKATLREVEPGLFKADYPGESNPEQADVEALPDSHLGDDAAGVKSWVEEMAAGLGYDRVEWVPPEATASERR